MEPVVLYRKYRPQKFSEVVGQKYIVTTLKNQINSQNFGHAYLFFGPRGTGKTTVARLLAKAINCSNIKGGEPCNQCKSCGEIQGGRALNLIEIDAASNRGIDEIRELREKVKFTPTGGRFKVFIIDEVHMLTQEAFNALLKTLEEPPRHAIFVLATTEIHRVPETIMSRCQRFDFKKLRVLEIEAKLKRIIKKEKIKINPRALQLIGILADGAIRDAESLLEELIAFADREITEKEISTFLGIAGAKTVYKFVRLLLERKTEEALRILHQVSRSGYDLEQFTQSVIDILRKVILYKTAAKKITGDSNITVEEEREIEELSTEYDLEYLLYLIRLAISAKQEVRLSTFPELPLELVIVEVGTKEKANPKVKGSAGKNVSKDFFSKREKGGAQKSKAKPPKKTSGKTFSKAPKATFSKETNLIYKKILKIWPDFIDKILTKNRALSVFLKNTCPVDVQGEYVVLVAPFAFHKEQIENKPNRTLIEETLERMLAVPKVLIKCILEKDLEKLGLKKPKLCQKKAKRSKSLVGKALGILGGEVVE